MNKKILLSILLVLVLAVSCKNNTTDSTATTKVTFDDFRDEISNSLEGLDIATTGQMPIPAITYAATGSENTINIQVTGANNATASSEDAATKMQTALNGIANSKIKYTVTQDSFPTSTTDVVSYEIVMTPTSGEFDVNSFINGGLNDTAQTTAQKITFWLDITPNNATWTDVIATSK
ncbi:hypothetical protein [Brachyspira sp. G79]|uniref:hypothetical protein n=1 Tax=Brachyspira sp. G79 TaxID=1358104 RepID=UPI000BBBBCCA|nr:hypothetical protein [Brachyspira sp. G79]PCG20103.1 hypothetical protein KQ44_08780 [Brachyspira sp. G79]